jgi:hypothetical protein
VYVSKAIGINQSIIRKTSYKHHAKQRPKVPRLMFQTLVPNKHDKPTSSSSSPLAIKTSNKHTTTLPHTTMGETTINGACLCKGIHFTVTGQDKGAVLCHCKNCQSFGGSSYAHNYRMMKTKIEYQKGQDLVRSYKDGATKSGKVLERFFCSRCVC